MTLRKITIDDSVRYIQIIEIPRERDIKQKIKSGSLPRSKQNKNISRNSKKFVKDFAASGFGILK